MEKEKLTCVLAGASNFLNISTKSADRQFDHHFLSIYFFFVLLGTMMSQIKFFERNMEWVAVKGQPLVTKFSPVVFCV